MPFSDHLEQEGFVVVMVLLSFYILSRSLYGRICIPNINIATLSSAFPNKTLFFFYSDLKLYFVNILGTVLSMFYM